MEELFKNSKEMKSRWKYFIYVGFPLWWRDVRAVISLAVGAFLFFVIALPIGFIITKKEERKKR